MRSPIRTYQALFAFAAISVLAGVTSCKKSKDANASDQISATINGTAFKPSAAGAYDEFSYINLAGLQVASGDSVYLTIAFPDSYVAGNSISLSDALLIYYDKKGSFSYSSWNSPSHGSVVVNSWDKSNLNISGTFSGVIYSSLSSTDSVTVTDGKFNTSYTQE